MVTNKILEEFKYWLNDEGSRKEGLEWDEFLVFFEENMKERDETEEWSKQSPEEFEKGIRDRNSINADDDSDIVQEKSRIRNYRIFYRWLTIEREKSKAIFSLEEVMKKVGEVYQELKSDKPDLEKLKKELLKVQIKDKRSKLERLRDSLESKLDENLIGWLGTLLEAQKVLVQQDDNSFAKLQFYRAKLNLIRGSRTELNEEELNDICQEQSELVKLEDELKILQKVKLETESQQN